MLVQKEVSLNALQQGRFYSFKSLILRELNALEKLVSDSKIIVGLYCGQYLFGDSQEGCYLFPEVEVDKKFDKGSISFEFTLSRAVIKEVGDFFAFSRKEFNYK